jgi:predicted alpha/beta hydrolase
VECIGPVLVRANGYLAWSRLGLGQDVPADAYRQWKAWCRYPGYWFEDPELGEEMTALFARVTVPISAVNSIDDRWSTPAARDAFSGLRTCTRGRAGSPSGRHPAGEHRAPGYFRRGSERLWNECLADLEALGSKGDR